MSKKVLILSGPTAAGKTASSLELARALDGEIISCDSMQVYKGLDIGTAKISRQEMKGIQHHLLDVVLPNAPFSVADFQLLAREVIDDIFARGKQPILVGGTGLYIQATIFDYQFPEQEPLDFTAYEALTNEEIHQRLSVKDELSAKQIEVNNRRRTMQALATVEQLGYKKSTASKLQEKKPLYEYVALGIMPEREVLYERINQRVLNMIADGLVAEVAFFHQKYELASQVLRAIGYKEMIEYLDGNVSFDDAIANLQQNTRRFAKRQLTWMRNQWIDYQNIDELSMDEIVMIARKGLA